MEKTKLEKFTIRAPLYVLAAILESANIAASRKEQRPQLTGVNLRSDENGDTLEAVATDSARLNRVIYDLKKDAAEKNTKEFSLMSSGNVNITLSQNDIETITRAAKQEQKRNKYAYPVAILESDGGKITFAVEQSGAVLYTLPLELIAGDYPEIRNLIPADNGAFMSFNPSFVGDLSKASKALKGPAEIVTMKAPAAPLKPFYMDFQSGIANVSGYALITPMNNGGNYPGFYAMKDPANNEELTRARETIRNLQTRNQEFISEIRELRKQLEERPAADAGDVVTLESVKRAHDQALIELTKALQEKKEAQARAADLEEKQKAASATIHEKHAENIRLLNKIKELEKALEEAQTAKPAESGERKPDGGKEPATEKQRAYIARLGGELPDGATIRDASILITQLKKARPYPAA